MCRPAGLSDPLENPQARESQPNLAKLTLGYKVDVLLLAVKEWAFYIVQYSWIPGLQPWVMGRSGKVSIGKECLGKGRPPKRIYYCLSSGDFGSST